MSRLIPLLAILGLSWPCLAQAPKADAGAKAEALARSAEILAREGDLDGALRLFEKAYDLDPDPVLLYNIGRVQEKKGDLRKARDTYERYLAIEKDPKGLERGRARFDAVLDQMPGRLVVNSNPADSTLVIDGKEAGPAGGAPPSLKRGPHEVFIRREGFTEERRTVEIEPDRETRLEVDLRPIARASPPEPVPAPLILPAAGPPKDPAPPLPPPVSVATRASFRHQVLPWLLVGSGGALLAGGLGLHLWALDAARDQRHYAKDLEGLSDEERKVKFEAADSAMKKRGLGAYVCYGLGAATAVTGVLLLFLDRPVPDSGLRIVPVGNGEGAAFVITGGFR